MLKERELEKIAGEVSRRVMDRNEPYLQAAHHVLRKHGIPQGDRGVYINQIPNFSRP